MRDRSTPSTSKKLLDKVSEKNWQDWRDFIVVVLAFIGLWHVLAGGVNILRMFS